MPSIARSATHDRIQPTLDIDRRGATGVLVTVSVLALIALGATWLAIALGTFDSTSSNVNSMSPTNALGAIVSDHASDVHIPVETKARASTLASIVSRIRTTAATRATITCDQYMAAPANYSGHRVRIRQADANRGTIRLVTPGYYVLDESIHFEPRADNDFRPECVPSDTLNYCARAYTLGFFAAITIEASDIVLDLNGYTIDQTPTFALEQRFYANVELASQPFRTGQGPAEFGATLAAANRFALINGHLGRSSHHGVHGNDAHSVYIHNVTFSGYEVAAIHVNGASDVVIDAVVAQGSRDDMPVIGTYSQARFLVPFADRCASDTQAGVHEREQLRADTATLRALMHDVAIDIERGGAVDPVAHPQAFSLFASTDRIIDGNAYGIVIHGVGVAVNGFGAGNGDHDAATVIRRTQVLHTHAHIVETITLVRSSTGSTLKGPAGDVLRITSNSRAQQPPPLFDASADGAYVGNALSDAQLSLIECVRTLPSSQHSDYGTLSVGDPVVVDWRHGRTTLGEQIRNGYWQYARNGDSMFHVQKGTVGIRIDNVRNVVVSDVRVEHTVNDGYGGQASPLPGEATVVDAWYRDGDDGGHPAQGLQDGYMGADTRGMAISGSRSIYLDNVTVDGVHSRRGNSRGIDVFNYATDVFIGNTLVNDVTTLPLDELASGHEEMTTLRAPMAIGLHTSIDSGLVVLYNFHAHHVETATACQAMAIAAQVYDDDAVRNNAERRTTAQTTHTLNTYTV